MELAFAQLSATGPVRPNNEDCVGFWKPDDPLARESLGAVAVLADGVGGHGHGEVASRLAVETALRRFVEARPDVLPSQLLVQIFKAANQAVYGGGGGGKHEGARMGRMATTLTVSIFRHNKVTVGHVGDCRAYVLQQGRLRRVTNDHSYAGVQLKLGLISPQDAMHSSMRSVLTRAVGQDPGVRADYHTVFVHPGDRVLQCSDGVHGFVPEQHIGEVLGQYPPAEACQRLVDLAVERGGNDNLSVQIAHILPSPRPLVSLGAGAAGRRRPVRHPPQR